MASSPNITMPSQPSYSEALSDSLKAQVDLLRGTGNFQDTGGLRELVRDYEAPLRQETAQVDTDVLRQTILGSQTEAQETEVTYDDQGRVVRGFKEGPKFEVRQKLFAKKVDDRGNETSEFEEQDYAKLQ